MAGEGSIAAAAKLPIGGDAVKEAFGVAGPAVRSVFETPQ
jgi:hypothetical protein